MDLKKFLLNKYSYVIGENTRDFTSIEEIVKHIVSYYENIIAHMPGNVYWLDHKGYTVGCNANVIKMLGLKNVEEFRGLSFEEMGEIGNWSKEATQSFKQDTLDVIKAKKAKLNIEEPPIPNVDGRRILFLTSRVPLVDQENHAQGIVGISIDITERKKMEEELRLAKIQAEAANLAKTAFIANMSHDLRTPLSGIIGISSLLMEECKSSKEKEHARIISNSSRHLLSLLDDILDLISVGEIQEDQLKLETFNLLDRLKHIKKLFASTTEIKQIDLIIENDENIPEFIVTDRIKLDRILLNLVGNALKFTEEGYVKISTKYNTNKTAVEFTISDTGIGIPSDKIAQVFDRFYRIAPSCESKFEGYGIGLFIVQKYIKALEGNISIDSELDKGTSIRVTIPIETGTKPIESSIISPLPKKQESFTPKVKLKTKKKSAITNNELRVLLVEDDKIARTIATHILKTAECTVDQAENAEQAFQKIMANHYDLIITDIGLPHMNGNEFAELTRAFEKASHRTRVPIVGLTAHSLSRLKKISTENIDLFVTKPIDEEKIKQVFDMFFPMNDKIQKKQT